MFFIVNKTKQTIVLGDMGVTLGPRQAVDLDRIVSREKSNASKYLKAAKHKGQIEIRIKDGEKPRRVASKPQPSNNLDSFKKDIIDEMKGLLSQQSQAIAPKGLDKKDLAEFAKEIIKSMPKQEKETIIIKGKQEEIRTDEEVEIDEETLAKINSRTIEGLVKDVKFENVKHKEHIEINNLEQNILELEDLLG